jgi:hypothetical protein
MKSKPQTEFAGATDLALTDLLTAAEDLFAARPNMTKLTIERRGDGAAWVKVDGHWLTTTGKWPP